MRRWEYGCERHELPSRYWEPEPDEEDLERLEAEYLERVKNGEEPETEELPFI